MSSKRNKGQEHYSATEMFYTGCSFAACGELCKTGVPRENTVFYSAPRVVNYAFSCEVFLKTLLVLYQIPKGHHHDLKNLYNRLPKTVQEDIESEMLNKTGKLTDIGGVPILDQISNAFVDWRYSYETVPYKSCSMKIDLGYLISFCETLRNKCCMCLFHVPYAEFHLLPSTRTKP